MTTSQEVQENARKIQQRIAKHDPAIMELDPTKPEDAWAIAITGFLFTAVEEGSSFTLTVKDDDDREESLDIQPMGTDKAGRPILVAQVKSTDGKLSPERAGVVTQMLSEDLDAEIDELIGQ